MPTQTGVTVKEQRKRAPKIDMELLVQHATTKKDDGRFMSHQEIADRLGKGVSRVAVTRALQRVPEWQLKGRDLEAFKKDRADILAQAQQLMFQYITHEKLQKASVQQILTAIAIMYDKERLERGKTTSNVAAVTAHKLDPETREIIQKAIDSRTKAMIDNTK